jgi:hypothetical protein
MPLLATHDRSGPARTFAKARPLLAGNVRDEARRWQAVRTQTVAQIVQASRQGTGLSTATQRPMRAFK